MAPLAPLSFPEFRPHRLLRSGHLQTLAGAFWPSGRLANKARQQVVDLPDGDQLVLHDDCPTGWSLGQHVALLVHGLGGSHASPYMIRIAAKLAARGTRVFRMDMRGCGAGYRLAQRPGHAGRSEDVAAAVRTISQCCAGSSISVAGFSLGGNLVLKFAGERDAFLSAVVESIIAVAPPIDLQACSQNIGLPSNRIYDRAFVRSLLKQIEKRRQFVPAIQDLSMQPPPKTLWEFDDRITAILSGFTGADDYYSRSSAAPLLAEIQIPTLILSAQDDPLIPGAMFESARLSETTQLHLTQHGGHVGFVGVRGVDPDRHWLDWRVLEWIETRHHDPKAVLVSTI